MKLFGKIFSIGVMGIVFSIIVAGIGLYSNDKIRSIQEEEAKFRRFYSEIVAAEGAHLKWLRSIDETLIFLKPEIKIEIDGKKCPFGQWYYSQEGKTLVQSLTKELQDGYLAIEKDHLDVHQLGGMLIKIWDPKNPEPGKDLYTKQIIPKAKKLLNDMDQLESATLRVQSELHDKGRWWLDNQNIPTLVTIVISVVALTLISICVVRGIVIPLNQGRHVLLKLAKKGHINQEIASKIRKRKDEIGDLALGITEILEDYRNISSMCQSWAQGNWSIPVSVKSPEDTMNIHLKQMVQQVNEILYKITDAVNHVNNQSKEIFTAITNLSDGAQISAARVEEITSSMSEIGSQTEQNAKHATEANQIAQDSSDAAAQGQDMMKKMIESMQHITQNAENVQGIIKVIDDIAFQTNLLALNAAVEAARAGSHGKGFAIVAEEVRSLAMRCAKAAGETSKMIMNNNNQINEGTNVASQTAVVLERMTEQIANTAKLINEISRASIEQSEEVNQITTALQQIETVTQQNTAHVEETASVCQEMAGQTLSLQKLIEKFELQENVSEYHADQSIPEYQTENLRDLVSVY